MAGKKENIKALFTNTRSRVVILITAALLVTAVAVGVIKLRAGHEEKPAASANVSNAPGGIQSIPGALNPTAQYANLQEVQNVNQARSALKTGGSSIPTIIRTQTIGEGVQPIGGQGGVGFSTLAMQDQAGAQRSLWLDALKNSSCSKAVVAKVVNEGASINDLKEACSCLQLKDNGYKLPELQRVCPCKELRAAGFNARQLKDAGFTAGQLRLCGFDACELRNAGFTAQQMKDGGFSDDELKGAGFSADEILKAGGLPTSVTAAAVRQAGCQVDALKRLRAQGVSAAAIRRISGCTAAQLKAAGFTAADLKNAGFSAADLKNAGFTPNELASAGYSADEIKAAQATIPAAQNSLRAAGCDVNKLKAARAAGVSATTIKQTLGCSAAQLRAAGYTARELKDAGFTAAELKNAGFSPAELKDAGFSAKELRDAGFSADDLKRAGFTAAQLKDAGFSAAELKQAGFGIGELKDAGFKADELSAAGFTKAQLQAAFASELAALGQPTLPVAPASSLAVVPAVPGQRANAAQALREQQLQEILRKQNQQIADQKYQQKIQQRSAQMLAVANVTLQEWKRVPTQVYTAGTPPKEKGKEDSMSAREANVKPGGSMLSSEESAGGRPPSRGAVVKTGDILFAVLDTSVNTDEPGPILATIISGKLRGAKLIGSFNLPNNAEKLVISFNTLSMPGSSSSQSISAYAIDPNTARTALSSNTDHHYLLRYGSLFASSFIEGFGNAFQSANTTVTIGGTGGGNNITVQNGIGRSALENAVIGLATVGKNWGQVAQQQFNRPTTVEVYSGTALGILFTRDLTSI